MSTASKKRKFDDVAAPTKYYAVRAGHVPGVYMTWDKCVENTTGFKGAQFKSFLSEQEAKDFVAGKPTSGASASSKTQGDRFYGVAVGKVPGVYTDWGAASEQIKDVKGPKYKKFSTRAEAEAFVKSGGKSSTVVATKNKEDEPISKKAKRSKNSTSNENVTVVYTDGSSRGNGKKGAFAGVGVFFGEGDERNVSEPLEGDLQTNQRAELTAVQRALEIVSKDTNIRIMTDSNYSINCSTVWYTSWKKNGWKTSQGGPVLNKDLVVEIRKLIDERDTKGARTEFQWIKGHNDDPGNEAADKLAVAGAMASRS